MRRKSTIIVLLLTVLVMGYSSTASAGLLGWAFNLLTDLTTDLTGIIIQDIDVYQRSQDVVVEVECNQVVTRALADADGLLGIDLATKLYNAQEWVHETVASLIGTEMEHFYIWVGACGQWAPIDPMKLQS